MNYRLLSVAEAELAETAQWYERQAPNLGGRVSRRVRSGDGSRHEIPTDVDAGQRTPPQMSFPQISICRPLFAHRDGNHRGWRNRSPEGSTACPRPEKEDVTAMGLH